MYIVTIEQDTCEGCEDCVDSCPVEILAMISVPSDNPGGERLVAEVIGALEDCLGCEACQEMCESGSITVMEV